MESALLIIVVRSTVDTLMSCHLQKFLNLDKSQLLSFDKEFWSHAEDLSACGITLYQDDEF